MATFVCDSGRQVVDKRHILLVMRNTISFLLVCAKYFSLWRTTAFLLPHGKTAMDLSRRTYVCIIRCLSVVYARGNIDLGPWVREDNDQFFDEIGISIGTKRRKQGWITFVYMCALSNARPLCPRSVFIIPRVFWRFIITPIKHESRSFLVFDSTG